MKHIGHNLVTAFYMAAILAFLVMVASGIRYLDACSQNLETLSTECLAGQRQTRNEVHEMHGEASTMLTSARFYFAQMDTVLFVHGLYWDRHDGKIKKTKKIKKGAME